MHETGISEEHSEKHETAQRVHAGEKEDLDPGLKSKSRLEYNSNGARIVDCGISSADSTPLNILKRGNLYFIEMSVVFDQAVFGVRYGMLIKTVVGTELGGIVSAPPGQGIDHVAAGTKVKVRLPFRPRLSSDTYFANVGVVGLSSEGEIFLHRIIDALIFRIIREQDSRITSSVDFSSEKEPVIEIA